MTMVNEQIQATSVRDGQHDFDFFFGRWHTKNRRLRKVLSNCTEWYAFEGSVECRPVWGGLANSDEADFEGPDGRMQGYTIRLYDPKTRLWSIYWATAKNGLGLPPTVGAFNDEGLGEFFDEEIYEGKAIICRFQWRSLSPDRCSWEQAFSIDGGKTWEANWIMEHTRI